jgi:hypothetical protein
MNDDTKLIKLYSGSDSLCRLLKGRLAEKSIDAFVKSQSESARVSGFGMMDISEVYVLESNVEKATEHVLLFEKRQNEAL